MVIKVLNVKYKSIHTLQRQNIQGQVWSKTVQLYVLIFYIYISNTICDKLNLCVCIHVYTIICIIFLEYIWSPLKKINNN